MRELLALAALVVGPLWQKPGAVTRLPGRVVVPVGCLTLACWSLDGPQPVRQRVVRPAA